MGSRGSRGRNQFQLAARFEDRLSRQGQQARCIAGRLIGRGRRSRHVGRRGLLHRRRARLGRLIEDSLNQLSNLGNVVRINLRRQRDRLARRLRRLIQAQQGLHDQINP
jgi:hypothetical protein